MKNKTQMLDDITEAVGTAEEELVSYGYSITMTTKSGDVIKISKNYFENSLSPYVSPNYTIV